VILYITHPAQLPGVSPSQTIHMPVSLLEERLPFQGMCEMAKRIRQVRRLNESTRITRKG
jgi:hypothetical protein